MRVRAEIVVVFVVIVVLFLVFDVLGVPLGVVVIVAAVLSEIIDAAKITRASIKSKSGLSRLSQA